MKESDKTVSLTLGCTSVLSQSLHQLLRLAPFCSHHNKVQVPDRPHTFQSGCGPLITPTSRPSSSDTIRMPTDCEAVWRRVSQLRAGRRSFQSCFCSTEPQLPGCKGDAAEGRASHRSSSISNGSCRRRLRGTWKEPARDCTLIPERRFNWLISSAEDRDPVLLWRLLVNGCDVLNSSHCSRRRWARCSRG